jgi:hypothetical protein
MNGELADATEPWRSIAERLNDIASTEREAVWNDILIGRDNRDEIIKAVVGADPEGPPPSPEANSSADEWPPLRIEELPVVDPFPVDVLPDPAAHLASAGADAIGCPPDFLGMAMLAVAAGTIGRSVHLLLKPGYFVTPTMYAACVGPPSDGKTPSLKFAAAAVRAIDDLLAAEYDLAIERWKESASGLPKTTKPPPPPKPRRIDCDDATMEVLPVILATNPRGLVMIRDELTAFVCGMNQFKAGKGNDRANSIKIWSGDRIIKDRVTHENNEPIRCPHPSLSIVGGLTPDMLGELADPKGRSDGFIDRFLMVYPDPLPVADWSDRGISDDLANEWRELIARLWMRPMDTKDGRAVPHVAYFTPEGEAQWEQRYNAHSAEMNAPDFNPHLRGPWGKLREYAGRLALLGALMHHAADPMGDPLKVPKVDPRRVDDAWRLISYFKTHARRIHTVIGRGPVSAEMRAVHAIRAWIQNGRLTAFSVRDIKQARRWIEEEALDGALSYLAARNAIRPRPAPPPSAKGGHPRSPSYDVNPALLHTQNPQNPRNLA